MSDSSCSTTKGLPEGILFEIFLRLPSKPIHRFKCVSKEWLSILSDPEFLLSKFKTLFNGSQPWAIFSHQVIPNQHNPPHIKIPSKLFHTQFMSSCGDQLSGYDGFSFNFIDKSYRYNVDHDMLHLLASSNGLVLCSFVNHHKGCKRYFVCNPVTEEYVSLPPPPRKCLGSFLYGLVCETYSSSVFALKTSFKVMRTPISLENNSGLSFEVEIYYSELDEWRTHTVAYLQPQDHTPTHDTKCSAITHNGVVYWLEGYRKRVVAYDLRINSYAHDTHHCNAFDVPIVGYHDHRSSKCLGVSEDYVCYGQILENTLRTWVLMEGDDSIEKSVWNLRNEIELSNFNSRRKKISIMGFSPMDRDMVILDCGKEIVPYDVTTGKSEFLQRICVPPSKKSFTHQHGHSPFIIKPTLTSISKAR